MDKPVSRVALIQTVALRPGPEMETNQAHLTLAAMLPLVVGSLEPVHIVTKNPNETITQRRPTAHFPSEATPLLIIMAPIPPHHISLIKSILVSMVTVLIPSVTLATGQQRLDINLAPI